MIGSTISLAVESRNQGLVLDTAFLTCNICSVISQVHPYCLVAITFSLELLKFLALPLNCSPDIYSCLLFCPSPLGSQSGLFEVQISLNLYLLPLFEIVSSYLLFRKPSEISQTMLHSFSFSPFMVPTYFFSAGFTAEINVIFVWFFQFCDYSIVSSLDCKFH